MSDQRRALMEEVARLRQCYQRAYDEAWRRERLYRYLYWREKGKHPSTNCIGSWTEEDLYQEWKLWTGFLKQRVEEERVNDALQVLLEARYGKSWSEALEEGTAPMLAELGLPIWNVYAGCLLPQSFGAATIFHASDNEGGSPGLGWTYRYGDEDSKLNVSVYIYDKREEGIGSRLSDPRVLEELRAGFQDMAAFAQANARFGNASVIGPIEEELTDENGRTARFGSITIELQGPDGREFIEALSVTGFRGRFLKVRVSCPAPESEEDEARARVFNKDLAGFTAHFE